MLAWSALALAGLVWAAASAGCARPAKKAPPGPVTPAPTPTPVGEERPDPTDGMGVSFHLTCIPVVGWTTGPEEVGGHL